MNWTDDLTKGQKRELRRIAELAHVRELTAALTALEEEFRRWRSSEIGPHDLVEAIHAFHQGPNRELWSRYNDGHGYLGAVVAVRTGVVGRDEVDPGLIGALGPQLESLE